MLKWRLVSYRAKFTASDNMKTHAAAIIIQSYLCGGADVIILALAPSCGCTGKIGVHLKCLKQITFSFMFLLSNKNLSCLTRGMIALHYPLYSIYFPDCPLYHPQPAASQDTSLKFFCLFVCLFRLNNQGSAICQYVIVICACACEFG